MQSLAKIAGAIRVLIGLYLVLSVCIIVHDAMGFGVLDRAATQSLDAAEADRYDSLSNSLGMLQLLALLMSAAAVDRWMRRGWTNLTTAGRSPPHSVNWMTAHWIIPVISLFRPYQNMVWLWRSSVGPDPKATHVGLWWGAWICGLLAGRISAASVKSGELSMLRAALGWEILQVGLLSAAGLLLLRIVREVTTVQDGGMVDAGIADHF